MRHVATKMLTAVLALAAVGCGARRPTETVEAPIPEPVIEAPQALEVREIAVAGDGRSLPIALAEADDGLVLFTTEPSGVGRYAIDLDVGTTSLVQTIALDRRFAIAAYDRAHDRLWWTGAVDQLRVWQPSRESDFPRGDLVVTTSSMIAHTEGLRAMIRACPTPVASLGGTEGPLCDHEIRTLLPIASGVVLGGHLAERVGQASARPWIGRVDESGTLMTEHRLPEGMGEAWIGALARSDAGVLAVAWSGRGEPARSSFLLFAEPTLELIGSASRTTTSWIATPWAAAVAAPDGGFWVALTTASHDLTIISIGRDGAITAEHTIEGAELPGSSVQWFGRRGDQPWLMIANPYAKPHPTLWAGRVDPASGAVLEPHEIALPDEFYPSRMLTVERGLVLAGRVGLERPLVVWVPLL